ncbi:hypothetical protein FRX31_022136 [Thalictrum thalictroides]|uniref:FAF domain-containing protein n=1 Tax=Thalictrum thalictroides TaxID=46969 RepID=A0A7J6VVT2_THATH|nr:hypothetical protein FRX31_022136 [Thalictrum thalictroides]
MAGGVYQSNEIRSFNPVDDPYATEFFGELYFKETTDSDPSWHTLFPITTSAATRNKDQMKQDAGMNSESTVDAKDLEKKAVKVTSPKVFPPPITSLDQKTGEPLFSLKSYRQDGRLVIKMVNNDTSCGIEPENNNNSDNDDDDDDNNNNSLNNNDEKKMKKKRMCKWFSFAGIFKLCASFKKDKK